MSNKNKIVLTILTCIFIALACIFGFTIANKQDLSVKADNNNNLNNFVSEKILLPAAYFSTSGNLSSYNTTYNVFINFSVSLNQVNGNSISDFLTFGYSGYSTSSAPDKVTSFQTYELSNLSSSWENYWFTQSNAGTSYKYFVFACRLSNDLFLSSGSYITKIIIQNDTSGSLLGSFTGCQVSFVDSNNYSLIMQIPYISNTTKTSGYVNMVPSRTIYVVDPYNLSSNEFYQTGYNNGRDYGEQVGYSNGYTAGSQSAQTNAYNSGYNAGVEAANTYSFLGMIGAAFDVPINAFKEMFDFNVLGVNLKDFFLGIFSLIIIIFVVRLILGGK